jgi:hypothetical protein
MTVPPTCCLHFYTPRNPARRSPIPTPVRPDSNSLCFWVGRALFHIRHKIQDPEAPTLLSHARFVPPVSKRCSGPLRRSLREEAAYGTPFFPSGLLS